MLGTLIWVALLVGLGIWVEKRYNPRLKDGYFHYTATKGVRNKKKVF